jgi:hypothetical protein
MLGELVATSLVNSLDTPSTLKVQASDCSKMTVTFYRTTQCHARKQYSSLHCHESLNFFLR